MDLSDIQLAPQELALLSDAEVLPLKHRVQQKLEKILNKTGQSLQQMALPLPWPTKAPKLSRGENYEQQAYRVMDYPRIQEPGGFLFFRTLILWGHPIGMHLIVSGHFMERLLPAFLAHYPQLHTDWHYAAQDTPWIWQAKAEGLIPCQDMDYQDLKKETEKRKFLKLSSFIQLDQYSDLPSLSQSRFAELHHTLISPILDEA